MKRWATVALAVGLAVGLGGCDDDGFFGSGFPPDAPRNLQGSYYNFGVTLTWELPPEWDGESFRVYGRRASDPDFFFIAEVTNCADGFCEYTDVNIVDQVRYEYFVSALNPDTGEEADSDVIAVDVPDFQAPPVPTGLHVLGLDEATFLTWLDDPRSEADFAFYRVYLDEPSSGAFLLGETDSHGFVDLLPENGQTYTYWVSAVDAYGHESAVSAEASGTPRPDYSGELLYSFQGRAQESGFRFGEDDSVSPVLDGVDAARHFRLEEDASGLWLAPGPGTQIHAQGFATTALACGVGADVDCVALEAAPSTGYTAQPVAAFDQTTYPMRVIGNDGAVHFGAVRIQTLGADQSGTGLMIFEWSYQLQAGNPALSKPVSPQATK